MPEPTISLPIPPPSTFVLVGHRTSGKTTLGRAAAALLDADFVDLDAFIEDRTGRTCADLVAEDEAHFRATEKTCLEELLALAPGPATKKPALTKKTRIIAVGAGCMALPTGPTYLWIEREGWHHSARTERRRLRPALAFDDELAWMRETREPRWRDVAMLKVTIPYGRSIERAAGDLATRIAWLRALFASSVATSSVATPSLATRTWVVPSDTNALDRALATVANHGFAGLEIRSDFFPEPPHLPQKTPVLASLRTDDPTWLARLANPGDVVAWDIDTPFVDTWLDALRDRRLSLQHLPERLLLSHHPGDVSHRSFEGLLDARRRILDSFPSLEATLVLKYAPTAETWSDLEQAMDQLDALRHLDGRPKLTFILQGADFAWTRPIFALSVNETNYLPVGLDATPPIPGLDFWLPHLAPPAPSVFDALLGDPVAASQGDIYHRRTALSANEPTGYLKIRRTLCSPQELEHTLSVLHRLPIRGLSVTAPLKRVLLAAQSVENPEGLDAANTLRRTQRGWRATDTDHVGMVATLEELEALGVEPGPVALFGRGGASHAVKRGLDETPAWKLVAHVGARQGWQAASIDGPVQLVVNAAGPQSSVGDGMPLTRAFVDLHYNGVAPGPEGTLHLQGDTFFEAQAAAQRRFWAESDDHEDT